MVRGELDSRFNMLKKKFESKRVNSRFKIQEFKEIFKSNSPLNSKFKNFKKNLKLISL